MQQRELIPFELSGEPAKEPPFDELRCECMKVAVRAEHDHGSWLQSGARVFEGDLLDGSDASF